MVAGENTTSNTAFEDLMLTLFAIILVGQIAQRGPEIISKHLGIQIGDSQYLVDNASVDADTPLQTKVNVVSGAPYYTEPSEGGEVGNFSPGTSLMLIEGPETVEGERWWNVIENETEKNGWVRESVLIVEGVGGIGPATRLGTNVRALLDTDVWKDSDEYVSVGKVAKGDWGTLTKGPQTVRGSRWWLFESDEADVKGWLPEASVMLASNRGWKERSLVRGAQITDIFERAGGGRVVGLLAAEEKAKILGGPVEVGGALWWLIETEEEGEQGWVPENALEDAGVKGLFKGIIASVMILGTILTLVFLGGIVYVTIRTNQVRAREAQRIQVAIPKVTEPYRNERWQKVLKNVNSENPSDWRFAILESDVMLDELFTKIGYQGVSLGEKLKAATRGDVKNLDAAWEAHKIRNQIAHEGGDYILTQRETKRVIELYAQVFREFKYI